MQPLLRALIALTLAAAALQPSGVARAHQGQPDAAVTPNSCQPDGCVASCQYWHDARGNPFEGPCGNDGFWEPEARGALWIGVAH